MDLEQEQQPPRLSRGIYLLPNLLTTAALFTAFYSIVAAMKGYFEIASIGIFIAMVADSLDGRVARMTHTQTAFGAQYDSLSDMVAFGLAPGLVIYSWSLVHLGKFGWLVSFLYTAATALRLARFNVQAHDNDKHYFQGLPCPAAAGVVAGMVWLGSSFEIGGYLVAVPVGLITLAMAILQVSTIRYYSFKKIDWKGRVPFFVVVILVLVVATIALDPPDILFTIFFVYAFAGPVVTLWQKRKIRKDRKNKYLNKD